MDNSRLVRGNAFRVHGRRRDAARFGAEDTTGDAATGTGTATATTTGTGTATTSGGPGRGRDGACGLDGV